MTIATGPHRGFRATFFKRRSRAFQRYLNQWPRPRETRSSAPLCLGSHYLCSVNGWRRHCSLPERQCRALPRNAKLMAKLARLWPRGSRRPQLISRASTVKATNLSMTSRRSSGSRPRSMATTRWRLARFAKVGTPQTTALAARIARAGRSSPSAAWDLAANHARCAAKYVPVNSALSGAIHASAATSRRRRLTCEASLMSRATSWKGPLSHDVGQKSKTFTSDITVKRLNFLGRLGTRHRNSCPSTSL